MIRFAPQTTEKAAVASKAAADHRPAAIPAAAAEPVVSVAIDKGDGAMLLAELPEISGPASSRMKKVRGERKPKVDSEAAAAQLALDA